MEPVIGCQFVLSVYQICHTDIVLVGCLFKC
uniref:Uncharacterized protein n=1 Tax=Arundo donax TaxID=35708 RepID=A0A0A9HCJ6_ARUDO